MSKHLINQYYTSLDRAKQFGKSTNEDAIKSYFWMLLNDYARKNNYEVVREVYCMGTKGSKVKPDGILKNLFGIDIGLWESKDEKDDIETEIDNKIKKGYPLTNILFEDSKVAILYQRGVEVGRAIINDPDKLHDVLTEFVSFKNETVHNFETALENFKADIPSLVEVLRKKIDAESKKNKKYILASENFLELCKAEINPEITDADIREMMIQHILTSDIFNKIFDDPDFHKHNNIGRELETLIEILFDYSQRKNLLHSIEHYYDAISAAASGIVDHHEKQKFLKVLYENFYKVYNPKAADRLGVVYTPNEIVRFMIESTDFLLHKFFGKTFADKNVEILDPATGTATYITALIDHLPKKDLAYKYKNEIHANEVAILPYYIANLNIEFTFKQKMGYYEEFKNLCFVDTLDNVTALKGVRRDIGRQANLFGLSSENSARIKRQNEKKISVVIGNPPYNSSQQNFNDFNKNREYSAIDTHIKDTFIKYSTAQKTKVYDMYARFYRWAMDRIEKNGIISFITNRSFIDSRTFDGFRKCINDDFSHCYIIDTKSDVRTNPKIAGTTHNVFGIQTGVAIMFLVKAEKKEGNCKIEYVTLEDTWRKEEKLEWIRTNKFETISFENIHPDKDNNWLNLTDNDWDELIPIASKDVKLGKSKGAIFKIVSSGISTNRDEWAYDLSEEHLTKKVKYFIDYYEKERKRVKDGKVKEQDYHDDKIKWTSELVAYLFKQTKLNFEKKYVSDSLYRPYTKQKTYYAKFFTHRPYLQNKIFPFGYESEGISNKIIMFSGFSHSKEFQALGTNIIPNHDLLEKSQGVPFKVIEDDGIVDNVTDWGLELFVKQFKDKTIKKLDVFHYTYAVLHNPIYRKKYELNLKREFPRLPFYKDFWKWSDWGKALLNLHINYEKSKPFNLHVFEVKDINKKANQKEIFNIAAEPEAMFSRKAKVNAKLKADKVAGEIELDDITSLRGIPKEAWEYKLGNRSALEWILDQYKEKKYGDPTITEKFNAYHFADYKEQVIDLIKRVTTVSVETMKIVEEMKKEST